MVESYLAGKRLSRKKLAKLVPKHKKYVEPCAGNAWVYQGCKETGVLDGDEKVILNDIRCQIAKRTGKKFPEAKISCEDYSKVIKRHDGKDTFFMIDPPYPNSCKIGYYGKHCNLDHEKLKDNLEKIKGMFMLTTSVDQKPLFCKGKYKCRVITSRGMYGRKLRDLVVTNY